MPPRHPSNDLICKLVIGSRHHRDAVLSGAPVQITTAILSQETSTRAEKWLQFQEHRLVRGKRHHLLPVMTSALLWRPELKEDPDQRPLRAAGRYCTHRFHCGASWSTDFTFQVDFNQLAYHLQPASSHLMATWTPLETAGLPFHRLFLLSSVKSGASETIVCNLTLNQTHGCSPAAAESANALSIHFDQLASIQPRLSFYSSARFSLKPVRLRLRPAAFASSNILGESRWKSQLAEQHQLPAASFPDFWTEPKEGWSQPKPESLIT